MKRGNQLWEKPMGTVTKLSHHKICCKYCVDFTSLLTLHSFMSCTFSDCRPAIYSREVHLTPVWSPIQAPEAEHSIGKKRELAIWVSGQSKLHFDSSLLNGTTLLMRPRGGYLSGHSAGQGLPTGLQSTCQTIFSRTPLHSSLPVKWESSEISGWKGWCRNQELLLRY